MDLRCTRNMLHFTRRTETMNENPGQPAVQIAHFPSNVVKKLTLSNISTSEACKACCHFALFYAQRNRSARKSCWVKLPGRTANTKSINDYEELCCGAS